MSQLYSSSLWTSDSSRKGTIFYKCKGRWRGPGAGVCMLTCNLDLLRSPLLLAPEYSLLYISSRWGLNPMDLEFVPQMIKSRIYRIGLVYADT